MNHPWINGDQEDEIHYHQDDDDVIVETLSQSSNEDQLIENERRTNDRWNDKDQITEIFDLVGNHRSMKLINCSEMCGFIIQVTEKSVRTTPRKT